jgi:hypothetical protein
VQRRQEEDMASQMAKPVKQQGQQEAWLAAEVQRRQAEDMAVPVTGGPSNNLVKVGQARQLQDNWER